MFHSARVQLTAWYLLIIMTISLLFSAAIYTQTNSKPRTSFWKLVPIDMGRTTPRTVTTAYVLHPVTRAVKSITTFWITTPQLPSF